LAGITPNKDEVTSSNLLSSLVWTCKKKTKKKQNHSYTTKMSFNFSLFFFVLFCFFWGGGGGGGEDIEDANIAFYTAKDVPFSVIL
jgi:hypothetical protein